MTKKITLALVLCLVWLNLALAATEQELHDLHQSGLVQIEQCDTNEDPCFKYGVELIRQAAEQNYAPAQYDMGVLHLTDEYGMLNAVEAEKWLRLAAKQDYRDACHNLGIMYSDGDGVPKNMREALHWFARSAELGDVDDMMLLATMYADGKEMPRILEEAYKWLTLCEMMDVPIREYPELIEVEEKCRRLSQHARVRAQCKALVIFAKLILRKNTSEAKMQTIL